MPNSFFSLLYICFATASVACAPSAASSKNHSDVKSAYSDAENSADVEAIEQIGRAYIKATFEADIDRLRELFHADAVMYGYLHGQFILGTPEPFFDELSSNPSMKDARAPYEGHIESVSITGKIGSLKIIEEGFGGQSQFTNYLQVVKINGNWFIMTKVFTSD